MKGKIKGIIGRVAALIMAVLFLLPAAAYAEDITIKTGDAVEGEAFSVSNMLPGDSVAKTYTVKVRHKNTVVLNFAIQLHQDEKYQKLAEVLKVRVAIDGTEIYDGLMKGCTHQLTLAPGKNSAVYTITAYLETSVGKKTELDPDGKRYMNKELMADFIWWYIEEDEPEGPIPTPWFTPRPGKLSPKTGDDTPLAIYLGIFVVSVIGIIVALILYRRRRDDEDER